MKLCLNLVYINFVTFMKRIGKMKGASKHGNEHSTFWAHFSTMDRIKLREIKVSRYNGNIVESGVKHHQANCFCLFVLYGYFTGMICGLQKQHSSLRSDSTPNMTTT
jgi:hypothetical protein